MFRRDYLVEAEKAIGIPEEKHPAGFLVTRVDSANHVASVIHEIDRSFHNSDFETASMTESEAVSGLMSTVGDIRGIVSAVSAVIALTIFLIAANAMSMMVRERLRGRRGAPRARIQPAVRRANSVRRMHADRPRGRRARMRAGSVAIRQRNDLARGARKAPAI